MKKTPVQIETDKNFALIITSDDKEELKVYLDAYKYMDNIDEMWNSLFRPRYKHGYNSEKINNLLKNKKCNELMDELEQIYRDITREE